MNRVHIRPLGSFDEFEAGVELQKKTWGRDFDDVVSAALMRVSQKIGGVSAGAFDADTRLVGMVFGLTGIRDDVPVHWSHMLAVEPGQQGMGLGSALKAYQRRRVMDLGIARMFWTFDPLEARNAHFNVNRLGTRIDSYVKDMYGPGETSPLHRGIGTDRFVAVWPLDDSHVRTRLDAIDSALEWDDAGLEADVDVPVDAPTPEPDRRHRLIDLAVAASPSPNLPPAIAQPAEAGEEHAFVEIPPDIQQFKASHPAEAAAWRTFTRTAFMHFFSQGRSVTGFITDPASGRCFYVLEASGDR